jgi:hypothetical protein
VPSDLTVSVALAAACELYAWLARLVVVLTAWEATFAAVLAAEVAAALAWSRIPAGVSWGADVRDETYTLCWAVYLVVAVDGDGMGLRCW